MLQSSVIIRTNLSPGSLINLVQLAVHKLPSTVPVCRYRPQARLSTGRYKTTFSSSELQVKKRKKKSSALHYPNVSVFSPPIKRIFKFYQTRLCLFVDTLLCLQTFTYPAFLLCDILLPALMLNYE